jgi:2-dehydropantoate 2-reductase
MKFNKIYVLGAGAVGCYFGGMLARAGKDVTFIARPNRVNAINQYGLEMDCKSFQEVIHIQATSDLSSLSDADLILVSVKSPDTDQTIKEIASIVPSHTVVLSLQNGVSNVEIASQHLKNPIYAAVVYVAAGMIGDRTMKHHGRGELYIGSLREISPDDQERLLAICNLFEMAGVPCSIATDLKKDMWLKFLVNCSFNAISGIGQITYGQMVRIPEVVQQIENLTLEFLAIAAKEGVDISLDEAKQANALIADTMITQRSSTAQDLARGKRTEIDFLNGYIVQLGKKYGVSVPYNESITAIVKMLEAANENIT